MLRAVDVGNGKVVIIPFVQGTFPHRIRKLSVLVGSVGKTDDGRCNFQSFNGFIGLHVGNSTLNGGFYRSFRHAITGLKREHQRGERKRSEQESEQFLLFLFEEFEHDGSFIFEVAKIQNIRLSPVETRLIASLHEGCKINKRLQYKLCIFAAEY